MMDIPDAPWISECERTGYYRWSYLDDYDEDDEEDDEEDDDDTMDD